MTESLLRAGSDLENQGRTPSLILSGD
jgi:hypothetical protein